MSSAEKFVSQQVLPSNDDVIAFYETVSEHALDVSRFTDPGVQRDYVRNFASYSEQLTTWYSEPLLSPIIPLAIQADIVVLAERSAEHRASTAQAFRDYANKSSAEKQALRVREQIAETTTQEREEIKEFSAHLQQVGTQMLPEKRWSAKPDHTSNNFAYRLTSPHIQYAIETGIILHPFHPGYDGVLDLDLENLREVMEGRTMKVTDVKGKIDEFTGEFAQRLGFAEEFSSHPDFPSISMQFTHGRYDRNRHSREISVKPDILQYRNGLLFARTTLIPVLNFSSSRIIRGGFISQTLTR